MVLSWVDSLLLGPTSRGSAYEQHGGPAAALGNELLCSVDLCIHGWSVNLLHFYPHGLLHLSARAQIGHHTCLREAGPAAQHPEEPPGKPVAGPLCPST